MFPRWLLEFYTQNTLIINESWTYVHYGVWHIEKVTLLLQENNFCFKQQALFFLKLKHPPPVSFVTMYRFCRLCHFHLLVCYIHKIILIPLLGLRSVKWQFHLVVMCKARYFSQVQDIKQKLRNNLKQKVVI